MGKVKYQQGKSSLGVRNDSTLSKNSVRKKKRYNKQSINNLKSAATTLINDYDTGKLNPKSRHKSNGVSNKSYANSNTTEKGIYKNKQYSYADKVNDEIDKLDSAIDFIEDEASEEEEKIIETKDIKPYEKKYFRTSDDINMYLDTEASEGEETCNTSDSDDEAPSSGDSFIDDVSDIGDETDTGREDEGTVLSNTDKEVGTDNEYETSDENSLYVSLDSDINNGVEDGAKIKDTINIPIKISKVNNDKSGKVNQKVTATINDANKATKARKKEKLMSECITEAEKTRRVKIKAPSSFVGFIRDVPQNFSIDQLKELFAERIDALKILSIEIRVRKRNRRFHHAFIYVKDNDTLQTLTSYEYRAGDHTIVVQIANETRNIKQREELRGAVAFIPRLPLSITDEDVMKCLEPTAGIGKIIKIRPKAFSEKKAMRHLLISFTDESSLLKVVETGCFIINGHTIMIREAFESGSKIKLYRAVYSRIPRGTTQLELKSAVELAIGDGCVKNAEFTFKNPTYAYITFNDEESLQKALSEDFSVYIDSKPLKVSTFNPRKPPKKSNQNSNQSIKTEGKKINSSKDKKRKRFFKSKMQADSLGKLNSTGEPEKKKLSRNKINKTKIKKHPKMNKDAVHKKKLKSFIKNGFKRPVNENNRMQKL